MNVYLLIQAGGKIVYFYGKPNFIAQNWGETFPALGYKNSDNHYIFRI
jgi:hypothetical protein